DPRGRKRTAILAPQHLLHHVGEEEQHAALRKRRLFWGVVEGRPRQSRQIDLRQEMERCAGLTVPRPLDVGRQRWSTAELAERTLLVLATTEPDCRLPLPVKLALAHVRALRPCPQWDFKLVSSVAVPVWAS